MVLLLLPYHGVMLIHLLLRLAISNLLLLLTLFWLIKLKHFLILVEVFTLGAAMKIPSKMFVIGVASAVSGPLHFDIILIYPKFIRSVQ